MRATRARRGLIAQPLGAEDPLPGCHEDQDERQEVQDLADSVGEEEHGSSRGGR